MHWIAWKFTCNFNKKHAISLEISDFIGQWHRIYFVIMVYTLSSFVYTIQHMSSPFELIAKWNQTEAEDIGQDTSFASKPEIHAYCSNIEELAEMSPILLQKAKEHRLNSSMRIEFNLQSKRLVLKVNAVDWFRQLEINPAVARQWIDGERRLESDARAEEIPIEDFSPLERICGNKKSLKCKCGKIHLDDKNFCKKNLPRRGSQGKAQCGWYVVDQLVIKLEEQNTGYVLLARPEETRDLILAPDPRCGEKRMKNQPHHNEELVADPKFWERTIITCFELSTLCQMDLHETVDVVCLNFGNWESGQAKDHRAITCHGHVHLNLTLSAVSSLSDKYPVLVGRKQRPKSFREINCTDLEVGGLLGREIAGIHTSIENLSSTVTTIAQTMEKVLAKLETIESNAVVKEKACVLLF